MNHVESHPPEGTSVESGERAEGALPRTAVPRQRTGHPDAYDLYAEIYALRTSSSDAAD